MKMKLGHCAFRASNLERSIDFYVNTLGLTNHFTLRKEDGSIWLVYLRTSSGEFIELFDEPGEYSNEHTAQQHICMIVDSIEKAAAEFNAKGISVYYGPTSMGNKASVPFKKNMGKCGSYGFFIVDPDGNEIEFHEFTPMSLQLMDDEKLKELEPLINSNQYVPEATGGAIKGK